MAPPPPPHHPSSTQPASRMVKLRITSEALAAAAAAAANSPPTAPPNQSNPKPKKPKKPRPPKTPAGSTSVAGQSSSSAPAPAPPPPPPSRSSTISVPPPSSSTGAPVIIPKIKIKSSALHQPLLQHPRPIHPTLKLKSSSFPLPSTPHATPIPGAALPTPTIKLKHRRKPVVKSARLEPGNSYDSEASDREEEPAIEEQFILRMQPGPDCDYLRGLIERKELSLASDVWLKFKDPRHCVVSIRNHLYGATLYDLPTILESSKTLDKKNIFKTADVCQMLVVHGRIQHESEVLDKHYPSPNNDNMNYIKDYRYPHGVTPPMYFCRRRRFRKRVSNRTIEAVEQEVERLLRKDEDAMDSKFELIDPAKLRRQAEEEEEEEEGVGEVGYDALGEGEYESGEGEEYDFFGDNDAEGEVDEDTLAIDLESALMGLTEDDPSGSLQKVKEESDDDDDDVEDDMAAGQMDEAALERQQLRERIMEEMKELQEAYAAKEREMGRLQNALLRQRCQKVMDAFLSQMEMKRNELEQLGEN
ncbi:hypothetical protein EX30DRAFT_339303 [Ascodesmis nigricans]|uniref:TAFII55 protein conserved region domain-containing protein n=1 Tax=Ascodesmis nigricans TaxID=341454 RepID=A0A4S2N1Q1_9PEZI|nr:hypothetical protein EX30DRAFT_339303 [Ascodesmis nigricans]